MPAKHRLNTEANTCETQGAVAKVFCGYGAPGAGAPGFAGSRFPRMGRAVGAEAYVKVSADV